MATLTEEDQVYIEICNSLAKLAHCSHRNVGAIIVDEEGKIVGHGYNRTPPDLPFCADGGCRRGLLPPGEGRPDYADCTSMHAEWEALLMAGPFFAHGATMYINSFPCAICFKMIVGARIGRLIWRKIDGTLDQTILPSTEDLEGTRR